jgi:hypothetical protein
MINRRSYVRGDMVRRSLKNRALMPCRRGGNFLLTVNGVGYEKRVFEEVGNADGR